MKTRVLPMTLAAAAFAALLLLTACSTAAPEADDGVVAPDTGSAAGMRLANGLYDNDDGTVLALGTLEWVDLEGGFYAITGSPEGGGTIAVIANGADFAEVLEPLLGKTVSVTGTRSDGVSVRMAGPEIVMESAEEISDTVSAAE